MKFKILPIHDKFLWEQKLLSYQFPSIFQSWNYGRVSEELGIEVNNYGIYNKEHLKGIFQSFLISAKRGKFLHIRGGPYLDNWQDFKFIFPIICDIAKKRDANFIRISPQIEFSEKNLNIFKKLGFINSPIPLLDAEYTWILNIEPDENKIMEGMRKTTRYLIKKAKKLGVTVTRSRDIDSAFDLKKLYEIMTKEKGIVPHKGITEEFVRFVKDDQALIFRGYVNNKLIGAALILFYGKEAIYHHSAHIRNEVPVSYLMQWEAILEAKKRGKQIYNFYGIEPTGSRNHPWFGLSLFKMGFGGQVRQFIRTQDYPLNSKYYLTWAIETARRLWRYKT